MADTITVHKRIEIMLRNIEHEVTAEPIAPLTLDFSGDKALRIALKTLAKGLKNPLEQSVILENDKGEFLGFNPHHYSHHRVLNVEDTWRPPFLTGFGKPAPQRESG
jgi:hypothetical protein